MLETKIIAEAGVRELHARYADAVWRRDWQAFGDCWTEDAEWRIAGGVQRGRAEIVAFLQTAMTNFHGVLMTFRSPIVDLVEGGVLSRVYVTENNAFRNGRSGCTIGTYFEKLVEDGGRWRRAWALFQLHYMGPADIQGPFFEQADYGAPPAFPPPDAMAPNYSRLPTTRS